MLAILIEREQKVLRGNVYRMCYKKIKVRKSQVEGIIAVTVKAVGTMLAGVSLKKNLKKKSKSK